MEPALDGRAPGLRRLPLFLPRGHPHFVDQWEATATSRRSEAAMGGRAFSAPTSPGVRRPGP
jgi:hypothetical protein